MMMMMMMMYIVENNNNIKLVHCIYKMEQNTHTRTDRNTRTHIALTDF